MTARKGKLMRTRDLRTGDTIMPPSTTRAGIVQQIHPSRTDEIRVTLVGGTTLETSRDTLVRVYRPSRVVNLDAPEVVFQSASA